MADFPKLFPTVTATYVKHNKQIPFLNSSKRVVLEDLKVLQYQVSDNESIPEISDGGEKLVER